MYGGLVEPEGFSSGPAAGPMGMSPGMLASPEGQNPERLMASNSVFPMSIRQALDPRINLEKTRYFDILKTASENLQLAVNSSGVSDSSLSFTNPFTPTNILDKRQLMTASIQYTAAGTAVSGNLLNVGYYDCPRQSPLQQTFSQMTSQINTTPFSLPINDIISGVLCVKTPGRFLDRMMSIAPMYPDQSQDYSLGFNTNRTPMATYGDNPCDTPRAAYTQIVTTTNTGSSAIWTVNYGEVLILPPYESGPGCGPGFYGVTTNVWNMTIGDITRSWSHMDPNNSSGSPVWTSFTASYAATSVNPAIIYTILIPHLMPKLPSDVIYPLVTIDRLTTTAGGLGAWSGTGLPSANGTSVSTNMITLSYIPSRVLVYVRESNAQLSNANLGYTKSDVFAGISSISITFNSRGGLLSAATQQQLYQYSVESGLEMSWPQFYQFKGSVLALEFGRHIPLINSDCFHSTRVAFAGDPVCSSSSKASSVTAT